MRLVLIPLVTSMWSKACSLPYIYDIMHKYDIKVVEGRYTSGIIQRKKTDGIYNKYGVS